MTDAVQIALIVASGAFAATIGPSVLGYLNYTNAKVEALNAENRALRLEQSMTEQKADTREIKVATNHIKDELVQATKEAAHAVGKAEGIAEMQAKQNEPKS
jgi:hypothetical protein